MLLRRDAANPAPAEEAFQTAIAVATGQGARSFGLRAALSLAKLYQSTARLVDAHAVLAPALEGMLSLLPFGRRADEGFAGRDESLVPSPPTPLPRERGDAFAAEMPEIAEAEALLAALAETAEVKADVAQRRRMTQLQAAYGAALIAARGFGAPETTEAFARARESAAGDDSLQRLAADYGLWAASYVRGDLPSMKAQAAAFLVDVAAKPDFGEAGIAHRVQGMTHLFGGEFVEAARELEHALALFQFGRDDDLAVRFPPDPGAAAMIYLAFASWALGEFGQAASLIERMRARVEGLSHAATLAHATALTAFFALMRGDRSQAGMSVSELTRIVRDHELPLFRAIGGFLVGWADADGGALAEGLEAMRRGVENLRQQNAVVFDGIIKIALAQAEARAGDPGRALAILDEALATCERQGYRAFECEIHRARGVLLLRPQPADPALAEGAFKTAVAIAERQGARGYQLLAALSLAKLYQSTGRPAEAQAVLAPALEGFAPTPEMPEIAEAEALLDALAETDAVKAETAQRRQRLRLQVAYGNALIGARGHGAAETTEAFTRARELGYRDSDAPERTAVDYGLWAGSYLRGELPAMRAHSAAFLANVVARRDLPEAGVAHRIAGITHWFAGEFAEARRHFERALALFQAGRDDDLAFRFGLDPGVGALAHLASASWVLGEVGQAGETR